MALCIHDMDMHSCEGRTNSYKTMEHHAQNRTIQDFKGPRWTMRDYIREYMILQYSS